MKVIFHKEFDGTYYVGSCENLPGCYEQASSPEELMSRLRRAIELYRKSYVTRKQELPTTFDKPIIDKPIRFHSISIEQLKKILQKFNYHLEYEDNESTLFFNANFPFNRVHLPNSTNISYLIISKIFGRENVIYINHENLSIQSSA